MQPDPETKAILSEQAELKSMVLGTGWGIARGKLTERVMDLQNAFNIEEATPEKMFLDLQSRKMASMVLLDWLRDIEGSAAVADEVSKPFDRGYIVNV